MGAAAVLLLGFHVHEYAANAAAHAGLATMPAPTAATRVLVVAPHPDDEVLASGGYLARAAAAGAPLRVIVATSGDGFRRAAMAYFHTLNPSPRDYIRLGYAREAESRASLAALGIPAGRASFLGFPDGGMRTIWQGRYSAARPYRSRYTRADHVPYRDAYRPGAPYDAAALQGEIGEVIRRFRPTVVLLPDPNDFNPDHRAVGAMTMMALARAAELGPGGPRLYFYLVHHGKWPTPAGDHPGAYLVPPADLDRSEGVWLALPLSRREEIEKRRAIERDRSQMMVMGDWLLSFDRRDELFARGAVPAVPVLPGGHAFPGGGPTAVAAGTAVQWRLNPCQGQKRRLGDRPRPGSVFGLRGDPLNRAPPGRTRRPPPRRLSAGPAA